MELLVTEWEAKELIDMSRENTQVKNTVRKNFFITYLLPYRDIV